MIELSPPRHTFSSCPCGHGEHVGAGWGTAADPARARCLECEAIEQAERCFLAFVTIERATRDAIADGMLVKFRGRPARVLSAAQIFKLNGKYPTEFVRVKLRGAA